LHDAKFTLGGRYKKKTTSLQAEMAYEGALAGARCSTRVLVTGLVLNTARVPLAAALARRDGPLGGATGVWIALSITTALKALVKCARGHGTRSLLGRRTGRETIGAVAHLFELPSVVQPSVRHMHR
jgi:hypothetical protein